MGEGEERGGDEGGGGRDGEMEEDLGEHTEEQLRAIAMALQKKLQERLALKELRAAVDKETLKAMLRRENELRLSPEMQQQYTEAETHTSELEWMEVTSELQRRVAREFGFTDVEKGVQALRTASQIYPEEPEMQQIPLYVRYNRCRNGSFLFKQSFKSSKKGDLQRGEEVTNVELMHLEGERVSKLLEFNRVGRPLVLFAGSYT